MLGGAAILARREMIEQVGGFDERFHMYAEDNEWCWRITKLKLAFAVCSGSAAAASRRAKLRQTLVTCGSDSREDCEQASTSNNTCCRAGVSLPTNSQTTWW